MAIQIVTLDGRRFTPDMRDAIVEARSLLPFTLRITQGGFNRGGVSASAGTHDGDAVDFSVSGLSQAQVAAAIAALRRVGIAAWFRTTSVAKWGTRAHGFGSYHIHGVPNGWGAPSSGAARQAASYRSGRDGLASNQLDRGPGHVDTYRLRTWAGYQSLDSGGRPGKPAPTPAPAPIPQEDIMATKAELAEVITELVPGLVTQALERPRYVDRTGDEADGKPLSHFVVQGHVYSAAAARNTAALLARSGLDAGEVIRGVVAGISGEIRESVVDAMGEIDREFAEAVADDVLDGLGKRLGGVSA